MTNRQLLNYWKKNFNKSGIKPEIVSIYIAYIERLLENKVPIIFDFKHLALLLGRSPQYLASIVNASNHHYREFSIPKRSGGHRIISAPYPALLECQYWIYENILKQIPIHACAHGFNERKSIVTNASIHINQNVFLKLDLKDFFPSISINRLIKIFRDLGYTEGISFYLASICSFEGSLPQGAPTSPCLSNIVAYSLDKRLFAFCKHFKLRYTRYADDLAFSGDNIPYTFLSYIRNIIQAEGFTVNESKTILSLNKSKRILTGISISGKKIALPRDYKRKLKQEVHYIIKYGLYSHVSKKKIKNPDYIMSIYGKLNFWAMVEPSNPYVLSSIRFFKENLLVE